MSSASDNPTPAEPRRFWIRLPRPLGLALATIVLIVTGVALRIGVLVNRQQTAIREIERTGNDVVPPSMLGRDHRQKRREYRCPRPFQPVVSHPVGGYRLARGGDQRVYVVHGAQALRGKEIWLRAEQINGRRVLRYRFMREG